MLRNCQADSAEARRRKDFRASVVSLATAASEMHYAESDGYRVALTAEGIRRMECDELALFLMVDGQAEYEPDGAAPAIISKGGFFLLDGMRPGVIRFSRHAFIQLDLSRSLLASLFPTGTPDPGLVGQALARSQLAGLLRDHLLQFPRIAAGMAPLEQAALLDASESFALTTIQAALTATRAKADLPDAGLFAAAQRHIRRHLANPGLNPAAVAAAVGCSRSTLYRLFGKNGLSVSGHIRELRLRQFRQLLRREEADVLPLYLLAQRCGLYDTPNVNRLFRKRFGVSPSDAREASSSIRTA